VIEVPINDKDKIIGVSWTHVWIAAADLPKAVLARAARLLNDEETRRVEAFRFDSDRRMSLVARAALRSLLGRHLGVDPRSLRFVAGEHGKPALAGAEIEFNVSHSAGHVAIAISAGGAAGVDIESQQRSADLLNLATRFFSPREAENVRAASDDDRAERFFAYWTAKESVIKAAGGGLSIDLRSFETDPRLGQSTPVTNHGGDPRLDGWNVFAIPSPIDTMHVAVSSRTEAAPFVRMFDPALL
jgi:4'-phosphopantetheinyl transferase